MENINEEKTQENQGTEPTVTDNGAGLQSETVTTLDRADQIAQMQKRENDRREALILREESLHAKQIVGGQTEAGIVAEVKVETDKEYKDRVMGIK